MSRTTRELVATVVEVDANITDLDPFILTANLLVTEVCVPEGYDDERLELIERWLAAHFYIVRDPRAANEKAGSVGIAYQFAQLGMHLQGTMQGQQALLLDTSGALANLNKTTSEGTKKKTLSATWFGCDE